MTTFSRRTDQHGSCAPGQARNAGTQDRLIRTLLWNSLPEISCAVGELFFSTLVGHLARGLHADIAYVARLCDWDHGHFVTLAAARNGEDVANFSFTLPTQCLRRLYIEGLTCYRDNIQALFPAAALQAPSSSTYLALPLKDAAGEPLGLLALLWEDDRRDTSAAEAALDFLKERVRAELERDRATEALQEQLHFMQQLVDAIPTPIFFKNRELRYIGCNRPFEHALGVKREEIIGRSVWEVAPEDFASTYNAADRQILVSKRPQEYEGRMVYADGRRRDVVFNKAVFLDSLGRVGGIVGTMFDVTALKAAERQVHHLAHYDPLTGLPNRPQFLKLFNQGIESGALSGQPGAVLCLDLDKFKTINDTFGHKACNEMLSLIARRLQALARERDVVARISGDRFAVALLALPGEQEAETVARRLLQSLRTPLQIGEHRVHLSMSIGVALFPCDGSNAETLLKHADCALSRAKMTGRNTIEFYDHDLNLSSRKRLSIESALHQALDKGEFHLHYQPQVELSSARLVGAEALLRWQSPLLGEVSPETFIPLAEENGLIHKIGAWVLQEACRQGRAWQDEGYAPIRIAVNLSSHQLKKDDFVDTLRRILKATRFDPRWLELEITETAIMANSEQSIHQLRALKSLGVHLSVDDFGTGYSSLSYLKRFPLDKLKIDRSFVRDIPGGPNDRAITEAILAMAHRLGLKVIAEGIETESQRRFLQANNCIKGQGYLFGAPVCGAEFVRHFAAAARPLRRSLFA